MWDSAIAGDSITPRRGNPTGKDSPDCMDALLTNQEGKYLLVDAGELQQTIRKKELQQATEFLFSELVAITPQVSRSEAARGLAKQCDAVIQSSGVTKIDGFRRRFPVECAVYGVKQEFHFTYGIGNGSPLALFQRVLLSRQQSVTSAALMLHEVTDEALIERERCGILYKKSDIENEEAEKRYDWLSRLGITVAVDDAEATDRLAEIVPSPKSP